MPRELQQPRKQKSNRKTIGGKNESFAQALKKRERAQELVGESIRVALLAGFRELFDSYPELKSFGWSQSQFEWNCLECDETHTDVSLDDPKVYIAKLDTEVDSSRPRVEEIEAEVLEVLHAIGPEVLVGLFGDDTTVVVDRNLRAEIREYEGHCDCCCG